MKILNAFAIVVLMIVSARALATTFNCTSYDGGAPAKLELTLTQVKFIDHLFNNSLALDTSIPYRSYTRIGNPWLNLLIPIDMVTKGRAGYVELETENLDTEETWTTHYTCTP